MQRRVARLVVVLLAGLLALPVVGASPAGAAPAAPNLISPADGATVDTNPILEWSAVTDAAKYRIQVATSLAFSTIVFDLTTFNTKATPSSDLAQTQLFWRVQALDASNNAGAFSTVRSFTKVPPQAPVPVSPLTGDPALKFPNDPAVLRWQPLNGARSYDIEIDDDPNFVPPLRVQTTTANTSYALTQPQPVGQNLYWRVRGKSQGNLPSEFSQTQTFSFQWIPWEGLAPNQIITYPAFTAPATPNPPTIEEIVLQWSPTPGAVTYDLQVSPNVDFTGTLSVNVNVKSTQYSPPTTLVNGSYYWRVRPKNLSGFAADWSPVSTFTRAWPANPPFFPPPGSPVGFDTVTLLTPADGSFNETEPTFTWTPVRLGDRYEIQFSTDVNFSPGSTTSCFTNHTEFTPYSACFSNIAPAPTTYYWRVRPVDRPANINGVFSAARVFQYLPNLITTTSPANGTVTSAPVLTWQMPADHIGKYRVTVRKASGSTVTSDTYNTSFTPQGLTTADCPATTPGSLCSWYVQTIGWNGALGPVPNASLWRTFQLEDPPSPGASITLNPPVASSIYHPPTLSWSPVTNAKTYRVWWAVQGSAVYAQLNTTNITTTAYAHPAANLPSGNFTYFVEALDNNNQVMTTSGIGSFSISQLQTTQLTAPANCPPAQVCQVLYDTPTLDWNRVPGADHYIVYLATDQNFTNIFSTVQTAFTKLTPIESLKDSQAGQATFWYARPCYDPANIHCGPEPASFTGSPDPPFRAFKKQARPINLFTPADGATVTNQVTFDWEDFLLTNQTAPAVTQEAKTYKIEVSTTADFTQVIDSKTVDQTTYTTFDRTYPEGDLWWRVQAIDGSDNPLTWSPVRKMTKKAPPLTGLTPTANTQVAGQPLFTWNPQSFAGRYEIEVYKNPDQPLAPANRVFSVQTGEAAAAPTNSLPPGDYGWRLRRLDADSRAGQWYPDDDPNKAEELVKFSIVAGKAQLVSPANAAQVPLGTDPANTLLLDWDPVVGASQYRVEISTNAGCTAPLKETKTTVMTAFAPEQTYPNATYFWQVVSLDGSNNTLSTSDCRSFTKGAPVTPGVKFTSLTPARILDSRPTGPQVGPYGTPWGAGTDRDVQVTGVGGVPGTAKAVTLNVTVTSTTAASFLSIYPNGTTRPLVSSLNWSAGQTIPNAVTVKVGASGKIRIFNPSGTVHVIVDVVGYYDDSGDGFTSLTPSRIVDSRPPPEQVGPFGTPWGPNTTRNVTVTNTGGVPANATAVVLNVTATGTTAASFLTIWPAGQTRPNASSLNWSAGQTIPNAVTVKVGAGGQISLFNPSGNVNVIVDVVGYFANGSGKEFHPIDPTRIQDSRPPPDSVGSYTTPWGANATRDVQIANVGGVPTSAEGVLMNATVTSTTAASFLTIWPAGQTKPTASSLNWSPGVTIANAVTAKVGNNQKVSVFNNSGNVHVLFDAAGWYG